jgi:hypothetical protein
VAAAGQGGASIGSVTTNGQNGQGGALAAAGNTGDVDWSNAGTGGANSNNGGPQV